MKRLAPWLFSLALVLGLGGLLTLVLTAWERSALDELEASMVVTSQAVADFTRPELERGEFNTLPRLLKSTQDATNTRIRILDADRRLIADSLQAPNENAESLRFRPEIGHAAQGNYAGYTRLSDENPLSLALFVAMPIRSGQGQLLGIAYLSHSTDSILQRLGEVRRTTQRILAALTLLLFGATISVSQRLRRSLRRLRQMTGKEQSEGDVVEAIGEGINALVADLQHKVAQLEEEKLKTQHFLEDVAHELKTPITGISGSLEAMQKEPDPDRRKRLLSNLEKETRRLSELVSQLLELQNLDYYQVQAAPFEVLSLLETAADTFETEAARKHIELEVLGDEGLLAWGDTDKLLSVLSNLVDNAIRCAPEESHVRIEATPEGNKVRLAVIDQGPGFDHSLIARRRRNSQSSDLGSCGLGLAIASRIVGLHGDQLKIEPGPEGGSRIHFLIKQADNAPNAPVPPDPAKAQAIAQSPTPG
jgi:signal transduction histidine kinase